MRFFILRGHYRSPLNYSDVQLQDAKNSLDRLYRALRGKSIEPIPIDWSHPDAITFQQAMNDDFNTPEAVAVLFKVANDVLAGTTSATTLKTMAGLLGLLQRDPQKYFTQEVTTEVTAIATASSAINNEEIAQLIEQRTAARKSKNFKESDRIRDLLAEKNVVLEDSSAGTIWRRG